VLGNVELNSLAVIGDDETGRVKGLEAFTKNFFIAEEQRDDGSLS